MESVIQKIANKNFDEEVHNEFTKFSRGIFQNRYLIEAKRQKDKWSIKTSSEFANFLVKSLLEKESIDLPIKGIIVSTLDITSGSGIPVENIKKYIGIQQAVINTTISPKRVLDLMNKYPKGFFALSFKTQDSELKIKEKAPKSGKPASKGDDGPKADFCALKTTNEHLVRSLLFDCPPAIETKIVHTLEITDIKIPKGISDPKELREKAVRKGRLIGYINADGKKIEKSYDFEA